jgi:hypothetical protein
MLSLLKAYLELLLKMKNYEYFDTSIAKLHQSRILRGKIIENLKGGVQYKRC